MKVKVGYEASRIIEIDLDEKYRPLCENNSMDYTEEEEDMINEMLESVDNYIRQIDPDFLQSDTMSSDDPNFEWEW